MKSGVGRNSGAPPAPGSSAPAPGSPKNSRSSASDTSLTASSSAGTRLPTSVVERKSSTARPHFSSAKRSRIFHRSFPSQSPSVPPLFIHTIWMGILTIRTSLKRRCTRVTVKSPIKQMVAYFRILCTYASNITCTNRSQNGNIAA